MAELTSKERLQPSLLDRLTDEDSAARQESRDKRVLSMRGLRRAGFSVPDDLSVLGFDGIAIGELLAPPLASVATPNRDIGRHAWQRLVECIGGVAIERTSLILPHVVRDGATIAPPATDLQLRKA